MQLIKIFVLFVVGYNKTFINLGKGDVIVFGIRIMYNVYVIKYGMKDFKILGERKRVDIIVCGVCVYTWMFSGIRSRRER